MKRIVFWGAAFLLLSSNAEAGLRDLIQQNVKDAVQSYERTVSPMERQIEQPQLWIHMQSANQKALGEEIFKKIENTKVGGEPLERKPIQIVSYGPRESQLRYFKKQDKPHVTELFATLCRLIPALELKDFSSDYEHVKWIKPGHFELWLSPELEHITPPE